MVSRAHALECLVPPRWLICLRGHAHTDAVGLGSPSPQATLWGAPWEARGLAVTTRHPLRRPRQKRTRRAESAPPLRGAPPLRCCLPAASRTNALSFASAE